MSESSGSTEWPSTIVNLKRAASSARTYVPSTVAMCWPTHVLQVRGKGCRDDVVVATPSAWSTHRGPALKAMYLNGLGFGVACMRSGRNSAASGPQRPGELPIAMRQ